MSEYMDFAFPMRYLLDPLGYCTCNVRELYWRILDSEARFGPQRHGGRVPDWFVSAPCQLAGRYRRWAWSKASNGQVIWHQPGTRMLLHQTLELVGAFGS